MLENEDGLLDRAIKKIREKRRAKDVFYAWPPLRNICERFADVLTDELPGQGGLSLLEESLSLAFAAYEKAEPGERSQMEAFLKGLLSQVPTIAKYKVVLHMKRDRVIWQPFVQSLSAWMDEKAPDGARPTIVMEPIAEVSPESIRAMIASRIMSLQDVHSVCDGDILRVCRD